MKTFGEEVRQQFPREVVALAIRSFHSETVRKALAMTGKPGEEARKSVVDPGDGGASLSETVYKALDGESPIDALGGACMARRLAYVAQINEPKYDSLEYSRVRVFFRRCRDRALSDMKAELSSFAKAAGLEVSFGS